jgi:hypothetical protein
VLISEAKEKLTRFQRIVEIPNGTVVLCSKIPGFRLEAFQRSHREPPPPKKTVEGFKGVTMLEEDRADPNYLAEMKAYEQRTAYDFMNIAMDHMVLLDENEDQDAARRRQLKEWGLGTDERSRIQTFVLSDPDDEVTASYVRMLSDEIMTLSTATAPEVAKAEGSFPAEVEQRTDPESGDAPEPTGI